MCKNCDYSTGQDNPSWTDEPLAVYCAWCGRAKPEDVHKCEHCGSVYTVEVPTDG